MFADVVNLSMLLQLKIQPRGFGPRRLRSTYVLSALPFDLLTDGRFASLAVYGYILVVGGLLLPVAKRNNRGIEGMQPPTMTAQTSATLNSKARD